eukprot:s3_g25.t1
MKRKAVDGQVSDSFIKFDVTLPSGQRETVAVSQFGTVADLKIAAQESLGRGFLRLAAPDGRLFDPAESLRLSGLEDGGSLTAVAQQPKLAATWSAFALGSDRVVTWGNPPYGGDSSRVQHQLKNVQQICGTRQSFASILADGSVVTWGSQAHGGDSSTVQHELRNVQQISATDHAFAAILADGNVVTWGSPDSGGDSSRVQHQLKNVQQICGTESSFAAILADGSVLTWGYPGSGGDSSRVQHQLKNVQQICGTFGAFTAVLTDGSVVTWGNPPYGGDSSRVQHQLKNVEQICGTRRSFASILADGSVVTWGDPHCGGDSSRVQHQLKNVQQICGTFGAFAAILTDGSMVTWGNPPYGGDSSRVQGQYQTGVLLPEWSREAAAKISELVQSPRAPNASSAILLLPLGGAVMHMRPEATAYCFRSMKVWVLVSGQFEVDSEERPKVVKWARQVRHELLPFSGGAGYGALDESAQHAATFAQDESEGGAIGIFTNTVQINKERRLDADSSAGNIFGSNLGRLQQIKAKYDPNNVFRANDNILPARPAPRGWSMFSRWEAARDEAAEARREKAFGGRAFAPDLEEWKEHAQKVNEKVAWLAAKRLSVAERLAKAKLELEKRNPYTHR